MKKERFEWIESWCEETTNKDKPRVLLIGDSITRGYQQSVKEKLKDIAYVDYIATSYSIDMKIYRELIKSFVNDSEYSVIHFNHGLHGKNMSEKLYYTQVEKLLKTFDCKNIILATSTVVYKEGNKRNDNSWDKKIYERNNSLFRIAREGGYFIDDLFSVSKEILLDDRCLDGIHYTNNGYELLANAVAENIKKYCK